MNMKDLGEEEAEELFNQSKEHFQTLLDKRNKTAAEIETEIVKLEKIQTKLVGKMKYQFNFESRMSEYQEKIEAYNRRLEARVKLVESVGFKPEPRSTVASAAINSALFGTAAGVAAAERTRAQNEQAQATYNSLKDSLREAYLKPTDEDMDAIRTRGLLEEMQLLREKIDGKICTEDDVEKYSKYLKVNVIELKLAPSERNLLATIEIQPGNPKLLNSAALLDGSLRLAIKQGDDTLAAGYYCAPGLGDTVYMRELGFQAPLRDRSGHPLGRKTYTADVILRVKKGIGASTLLNSEVQIEMLHLWLLEGDSAD